MEKYKIGLVTAATSKYRRFVPALFDSAQKFFFRGHDVRIFLCTDQDVDEAEYGDVTVEIIRITHEPWPYVTLKRYQYIDDNKRRFQDVDYLFWLDADMLFVSEVSEEILPGATPSGLVGVEHIGFCFTSKVHEALKKLRIRPLVVIFDFLEACRLPDRYFRFYPHKSRGTYETSKKSTAHVAKNEGDVYYAGGFWGGRVLNILQLAQRLRRNVEKDLSWGYIARWHDESHLNRYFIDHSSKVLSSSYCYDANKNYPIEKKILALHKDHKGIRDEG